MFQRRESEDSRQPVTEFREPNYFSRIVFALGFFWALVPNVVITGDCLSRPEPFQLRSDTVQWSMVVACGNECIQGLRGKSMMLESVSVLEQPKAGLVVLQGRHFVISPVPKLARIR